MSIVKEVLHDVSYIMYWKLCWEIAVIRGIIIVQEQVSLFLNRQHYNRSISIIGLNIHNQWKEVVTWKT